MILGGDTGGSGLDVSAQTSDAAFNREYQGDVQLTSGVSTDYTANLRCTYLSSASPTP
jgi:hypothetical protein